MDPEKLPGAVILGRVVGGYFVMCDGRRIGQDSNSDTVSVTDVLLSGTSVNSHIIDTGNPHAVTPAQIGAIPAPGSPNLDDHLVWDGAAWSATAVIASTLKAVIESGGDNGSVTPINVGNSDWIRLLKTGVNPVLEIDGSAANNTDVLSVTFPNGKIQVGGILQDSGSLHYVRYLNLGNGCAVALRQLLASADAPQGDVAAYGAGDVCIDQGNAAIWVNDGGGTTGWVPASTPPYRLFATQSSGRSITAAAGTLPILDATPLDESTLVGFTHSLSDGWFVYAGPTLSFLLECHVFCAENVAVSGGNLNWQVNGAAEGDQIAYGPDRQIYISLVHELSNGDTVRVVSDPVTGTVGHNDIHYIFRPF